MMKRKGLLIILVILMVAVPMIGIAAPQGYTVIKKGDINLYGIMVQYRLRDLGYLCYRPTGKFGSLSVDAIQRFQRNNDLDDDGQVGPSTFDKLFESDLSKNGQRNGVVLYGDDDTTVSNGGDPVSWSEMKIVFAENSTATLYDAKSKAEFTIKRISGGTGHAHVEPLTEKDTDEFYDMFTATETQLESIKSGSLTYEKRPCVIEIDEKRYAASLFGYVHGDEPAFVPDPNDPEKEYEDNGMNGYLCLYFKDSTSDVFNKSDFEHDDNIVIASQQ